MKVNYRIALEVASHEAIVRQAYKDSVGVWTWSVGLTSATGHIVERYIDKPQSLTHCLRVYVWALENYAHEVREAFAGRTLTEAQFAAALSFHWNTGKIKQARWVKSFLAGKIEQAKKEFMLYRKPPEIISRREKERDLFFAGKWSNNGSMTEYTRVKSNGQIDWSSARKINVEKELAEALAKDIPEPDKVIVTDTVTVEKPVAVPTPVAVVPPSMDAPWWKTKETWAPFIGTSGAAVVGGVAGIPWQNLLILTVAGLVIIGALLLFRQKDKKAVEKTVEVINNG